MNFTRTTAGAFAVSITTTAWENTATIHHTDLAGTLNDPGGTVDALKRMGLSSQQAVDQLGNLVQSQSVMVATDHIFLISALLFLFGAAIVWLAPKPKGPVDAGAGGH
jgi:DHA2 family multidrug resistance protein